MTAYPLQSVLELRRREEDEAIARLANATREREAAEQREARWVAEVDLARQRLQQAGQHGGQDGGQDGSGDGSAAAGRIGGQQGNQVAADALAAGRFVDRRRDEYKHAQVELAAFRRGALARARSLEGAARDQHLAARRARQTFEKHAAKHQAASKAAADRREEEALEDTTRASRHLHKT